MRVYHQRDCKDIYSIGVGFIFKVHSQYLSQALKDIELFTDAF